MLVRSSMFCSRLRDWCRPSSTVRPSETVLASILWPNPSHLPSSGSRDDPKMARAISRSPVVGGPAALTRSMSLDLVILRFTNKRPWRSIHTAHVCATTLLVSISLQTNLYCRSTCVAKLVSRTPLARRTKTPGIQLIDNLKGPGLRGATRRAR